MNSFSNLPEYLIDSVLQFTDVKDIVNFSNTNEEHKTIVNKLTNNTCSFISKTYEISELCDIETWIFLPYHKYQLKYAKQYYQIFKNIDEEYYLTFNEVHNIFCRISKFIKLLDSKEKNIDIQEKYMYVYLTLFELIRNNIYLFNEESEEKQEIQRNILNFLLKLYDMDINFIDSYDIYPIILDTFQKLVENINDYDKLEKQESFTVDFIQSFFFYSGNYNHVDDLHEELVEMMIENNMEQIMLVPEYEQEYEDDNDTIIDIDDLDIDDIVV